MKLILEDWGINLQMHYNPFTYGSVVGCCEYFGQTSEYIETGNFLTFVKTNLTHNIFVLKYVYCVYYIPLYVSSSNMLIIRRLNCINTASGIATLCRWLFGPQVAKELSQPVDRTAIYRE
jgi:hypothetical protein